MGDLVEFSGSKTSPTLKLLKEAINLEIHSPYPLIKYLNSAAGGLKLPRNPKELAQAVNWFILNSEKFENYNDCIEALKAEGIMPKSRVRPATARILRALNEEGEFDLIKKDGISENAPQILENILKNISEIGVLMEGVEDKQLFVEELENYIVSAQSFVEAAE